MNVAILGASPKPDRFANRAQQRLVENGHRVFPISPTGAEILGETGFRSITEIKEAIHTVTLYLGPQHLTPLIEDVISTGPKRIIFNPGTENAEAQAAFTAAGIETIEGCTLVMLASGDF